MENEHNIQESEIQNEEQKVEVIEPIIKQLEVGDKIWIVSSDGYLLAQVEVEKVKNKYAYADGRCYWRYAKNGKFRNRNNYLQFAMLPEDGRKYVNYFPDWFQDKCIPNKKQREGRR